MPDTERGITMTSGFAGEIRATAMIGKAAGPLAALVTGIFLCGTSAQAGPVFLDNFDSVTPLSLQNDSQVNYGAISSYYDYGNGQNNGIITNCVSVSGGSCDFNSGNPVTSDVSGTGKFLFENTVANNNSSSEVFYQSISFNVAANTNYVFSYYGANATTANYALINSSITGSNGIVTNFAQETLNGPCVNCGTGTKWVEFSFDWNSGTSTSAYITLSNAQFNGGNGNDFGIDDIMVNQAPEPGTLVLFGSALLALGGLALRRKFG